MEQQKINVPFHLILAVLTLVSPGLLNGQSNFKPGYYITHQLDTVYGEIDARGDIRNARTCSFRSDKNAGVVDFKPNDILAYRFVNGKYYVSRTYRIRGEDRPVFAEYLVNGLSDLYYFRDTDDEYYYLQTGEGDPLLLHQTTDTIVRNGQTMLFEKKEHIGLMKMAFGDCMEIQPQLDNLTLTHKSLIRATESYHEMMCPDEVCLVYLKETPAIALHVGLTGGIGRDGLVFQNMEYYDELTYSPNWHPFMGTQLDVFAPRINDKIRFMLRTEFCRIDYHAASSEEIRSMVFQRFDSRIETSQMRTFAGLGYVYPKGRVRPSASAGVALNFLLSYDYLLTRELETEHAYLSEELYVSPLSGGNFGDLPRRERM
ncbi:MAG: hypothetical protein R2751_02335 [Bacteroidales bacterium]